MEKMDGTGSFIFLSIRPPWVQGAVHPLNSPGQNTLGLVLTGNHTLICSWMNTFLHLPASPQTVTLVSKGKSQGHQKDQLYLLFACTGTTIQI